MQTIQKPMRITAIVAASLIALSVLLLLITIPIQEARISAYGYGAEINSTSLPIFPTIPFIFTCLYLVCAVALIFACYGKTDRVAIEIIVFICLLIIPIISNYALASYRRFLVQGDLDYSATYAILTVIFNKYTMFSRWAQPLCLVVCGMSAVVKRMRGKATTQTDNSPVLSESL